MKWNVNLGIKIQLEGSDQLVVQVKIQVPGWEKHKQSSTTKRIEKQSAWHKHQVEDF